MVLELGFKLSFKLLAPTEIQCNIFLLVFGVKYDPKVVLDQFCEIHPKSDVYRA